MSKAHLLPGGRSQEAGTGSQHPEGHTAGALQTFAENPAPLKFSSTNCQPYPLQGLLTLPSSREPPSTCSVNPDTWSPPGSRLVPTRDPALTWFKHEWAMPRMLSHPLAWSMKPPLGGCPKHLEVVRCPFSVLDKAESRAFGQRGICPVAPEAGLDLGPSQPQIFAKGIHE